MAQGLLIIDMQNDYFRGGAMELVNIEEAAGKCARVLRCFREKGAPVFHVQHIATRPGATFFLPHTPGCAIHESVRPLPGEPVIVKHFPNSFRETGLKQLLDAAGVDEVVICGAMTHLCIDTTVRAAFDLGLQCVVVADGCATKDLTFKGHKVSAHDVQLSFLAALGTPFAAIRSAEECIAA